jgi:RNA polymerase sigma factor (sigma-70 family)
MPVDDRERQRRWPVLLSHREQLLRIARARTASYDDAEDCVQEALTRAAVHPGLDLDRAGAFLTTTTIRLTVDLHRERSRQARLQARVESQASVSADHADDVTDRGLARWLAGQAQALTDQEQAVLHARLAGDSSRDAASTLGISVRAAESSLTRVRLKLQTAWAKVAAVLAGAGLALRRHAAVSLPLTAVAAAASVGPMILLPGTGTEAPTHPTYRAHPSYAGSPASRRANPIALAVAKAAPTTPNQARPSPGSKPLPSQPRENWQWGWPRPAQEHDCQHSSCDPQPLIGALGQGFEQIWHPDSRDQSGHAATAPPNRADLMLEGP